jgi:hypothetical protein
LLQILACIWAIIAEVAQALTPHFETAVLFAFGFFNRAHFFLIHPQINNREILHLRR